MPSQSMFGSPCTWQRKPSSWYFGDSTMPDLASRSEASTSWVLLPIEETIPIPVTTTRLIASPLKMPIDVQVVVQPAAASTAPPDWNRPTFMSVAV